MHLYQEGNHTPSTSQFCTSECNFIAGTSCLVWGRVTGDELHNFRKLFEMHSGKKVSWIFIFAVPVLREVQLTGKVPERRNEITTQVPVEA